MTSERLTWNAQGITSETFDDEVVIVNFDSGKYHSLQDSARLIWHWLETPSTIDEILERSIHWFSGDRDDIVRGVRAFIATLQTEGLLVVEPTGASTPGPRLGASAPVSFSPPILNTFSDMQELLLLDPIHDVDEAGWPVAKANGGD